MEIKAPVINTATIAAVSAMSLLFFYGANFIDDSYLSKKVEKFEIKNYKYGVFLSEPESGVFYNFTPYSDFYTPTRESSASKRLIDWSEGYESQEYLAKFKNPLPQFFTIGSYLGILSPSATFNTSKGDLKYSTHIIGNKVVSKVTGIESLVPTGPLYTGITLNESDYIFDERLLLLRPKEQWTLDEFKDFYQVELGNPGDTESWYKIHSSYVFVVNPANSGVIRVKTQGKEAYFAKEEPAIYFLQDKGQPEVEVELFSSFFEARKL